MEGVATHAPRANVVRMPTTSALFSTPSKGPSQSGDHGLAAVNPEDAVPCRTGANTGPIDLGWGNHVSYWTYRDCTPAPPPSTWDLAPWIGTPNR